MSKSLPVHSVAGKPHPCCVPSVARSVRLAESRELASRRQHATKGSTEGMLKLDGGPFWMGTEDAEGFPLDGEGPIREVTLDPFYIDAHPVTNEQFREFVRAAGYKTDAERFGWSFVFHRQVPPDVYDRVVDDTVLGHNWWCKVSGADWAHPEGPDTGIDSRLDYPASHVSWNDACEYARWAGKRLPTEAEFEYAARGGLEQKRFAWGDELTPGGKHMCNIWQGNFPHEDSAEDGYSAPNPVAAFAPNGHGMYSPAGNVWEWVNDWFSRDYHVLATPVNPQGPPGGHARVMRGGSFLCHHSYCNRYRVAARTSNTPDSSTTNLGFRCARDL